MEERYEITDKEELSIDIDNVKECVTTFATKEHLYFVYQRSMIRYTIEDNSFTKVIGLKENIIKLVQSEDNFYYWRTIIGGHNEDRFYSKIYFDSISSMP